MKFTGNELGKFTEESGQWAYRVDSAGRAEVQRRTGEGTFDWEIVKVCADANAATAFIVRAVHAARDDG